MRFSELLDQAGLGAARAGGAVDVRRVVIDSRRVQRGDCFVAVRGTAADGHRYIGPAVSAGCSAVVCEDASAVPEGLGCAVVPDTRLAAGLLAQAIRGWPARRLRVAGVTGTNGKTTFAYLLRHILQSRGARVALLGTINYELPDAQPVPAPNTTPGPIQLAEMMDQAVAAGATDLVMEVSSHALHQQRVAGIEFAAAAFTNLTGDHLDYHGTMQRYFEAKRRLFESLSPRAAAVLNRDDRWSEPLAAATRARVVWYGLSPAAEVWAQIERIEADGTEFVLRHGPDSARVHTRLIGRHNVYNCLTAAASALALGVGLDDLAAALGSFAQVPGRLQRVPVEAPFTVLVDYAHTDDAMENVLRALAPIKQGRLILVFGCGGDRDRTKRPRMARVAEHLADRIIVTSDNPRTEGPRAIISEIVAGFSPEGRGKLHVEPDRRAAIALAIAEAGEGDVVLLAGKGHENYQILGTTKIHFDDVEIAAEFMNQRTK